MSTYISFGEDQPFEWNIAPLSIYLYGVENPQDRPLFASQKIKGLLEERYREKFLSAYCSGPPCTTSKKGDWRYMVGATLTRGIYIFVVKTTVQQDLNLIREFNAAPNKNHFNGVWRNCANFTKRVINTYFPHATRAEYLNDFGMTSPKAVARSFTRYALRRPELQFRVLHFAQIPGVIKLSSMPRDGTEQMYHSKKLLVPMIFFGYHELPFFVASYVLTGRFNPEREAEEYPRAEVTEISYQIKRAKAKKDNARVEQVLAWLRLPEADRPHFITLYYAEPDHEGHRFGPDATETRVAVLKVDALMGKLMAGLDATRLPIDLVVVSDHGMAKTEGGWVTLDQFADLTGFQAVGSLLYATKEEDRVRVYNQLKKASEKFVAYRRKNVPADLNLNQNPRAGDPVVVATGPYAIRAHGPPAGQEDRPPTVGMHGFDPRKLPEMKPSFFAAGPDILPGKTVAPFENVNLYPWLAHMLGLQAPKSDGSLDILAGTLRDGGGDTAK